MSLKIRKYYFSKLSKKFNCKKINDLMLEVKIPKELFYDISIKSKIFISKCLENSKLILDEKELLNKLILNKSKIKNITPNGIIIPKIHSSLEFNFLVKSYVDILKFLKFEDLISNFHFPPNLRIKFNTVNKKNLKRKHPTEHMHSDTWTGANPNWIAVHCFILGDIEKNNIRYAAPPQNFNEKWLSPLENSQKGNQIIDEYNIIDYTPKKGTIIFADASIIHQSFRESNAGTRISLDTGFDMFMPKLKSFKQTIINNKNIKAMRDKETISKSQFLNIGEKSYFHFSNKLEEKVPNKGGFKHPTKVDIINLN